MDKEDKQFSRTFRVRHYECDAYGHVNHAMYLRWMQEAAFDASAAVGYDLARYQTLGHHWLVRETEIEYLQPLAYGDSVTVTTWVADFRRVRSRRLYELHRVGTGELAARGYTDWVYLHSETGRPATVPAAMMAAFLPQGAAPDPLPREPFPTPPPPPRDVFTIRRQVAWHDIDPQQHLNNAGYLAYMEEAAVQVMMACGWTMQRAMEEGFAIVARRYRIEYRLPALLNDELLIATWVSDVRRATAVRHYTVRRAVDGKLLARASALWVWVNLETGRPIRIPPHFIADFRPNIVGSA